jgi:type III restriction enzyme
MQETHTFKNQDLVLKVNSTADPSKLNLAEWDSFLEKLCGDRPYQQEAIKTAILFLASGNYATTEDLVKENYPKNTELQEKYGSLNDYFSKLQIKNKLFANIDLAT